jgi:single-stranded DNA-binding protein
MYAPAKQIGKEDRPGCQFNFYTADKVKNESGEWVKEFTSHTATLWGKEAEWILRDGVKGSLVTVSGTYRVRKWSKDGKFGAGTEIKATSALILDRQEEEREAHAAPAPRRPAPSSAPDTSEVPF